MDICTICNAPVSIPDEGVWVNTNAESIEINSESISKPSDGWEAYCLDDAPCECGKHPNGMSDKTAANLGYDLS